MSPSERRLTDGPSWPPAAQPARLHVRFCCVVGTQPCSPPARRLQDPSRYSPEALSTVRMGHGVVRLPGRDPHATEQCSDMAMVMPIRLNGGVSVDGLTTIAVGDDGRCSSPACRCLPADFVRGLRGTGNSAPPCGAGFPQPDCGQSPPGVRPASLTSRAPAWQRGRRRRVTEDWEEEHGTMSSARASVASVTDRTTTARTLTAPGMPARSLVEGERGLRRKDAKASAGDPVSPRVTGKRTSNIAPIVRGDRELLDVVATPVMLQLQVLLLGRAKHR